MSRYLAAVQAWAVPAGWRGVAAPCALCPPSRREKNYMCPLNPFRPWLQRKYYVKKIHEMCQNTSQSLLNFFVFPVVNGQSTCC